MTHPYATQAYVQSLAHMGSAISVPEWGCWLISRPIEGKLFDICGPYPIATISSGADLSGGMETLRKSGAVSVTLALDDFHRPGLEQLRSHFDFVRPFKTHYLVDRNAGNIQPSRHHRYEINRALKKVAVREIALEAYLSEWEGIYRNLITRHNLEGGAHDFSQDHFEALAAMKDVRCIGAFSGDELVAAHLWVAHADCVHSHLACSSDLGYTLRALYAVNHYSIQLFNAARIVNLGGGAGTSNEPTDGLARFKRGFANTTSNGYICGQILDSKTYQLLVKNSQDSEYFPLYRSPTRKGP
jgi:hypothetical protein